MIAYKEIKNENMIAHVMVNMIAYKEIKNENVIAHIMVNHT